MCRPAPPPGQVAPGRGTRSPGIMRQDAPGKRRGGLHECAAIENLEFHSELNYILYLPAVTQARISGNLARIPTLMSGKIFITAEASCVNKMS